MNFKTLTVLEYAIRCVKNTLLLKVKYQDLQPWVEESYESGSVRPSLLPSVLPSVQSFLGIGLLVSSINHRGVRGPCWVECYKAKTF